ncbi:MAG: hypothetical protein ABIR06_07390 [Cyclobacteriaceae bacterium]
MATTSSNKSAPRLSRSAFWDIDLDKLDLNRYGDFAIIRVFERGTLKDIQEIVAYFGKSRISETLTNASTLQPRAIALGEKLLDLSSNQFSCLKPSPQPPSYSRY